LVPFISENNPSIPLSFTTNKGTLKENIYSYYI